MPVEHLIDTGELPTRVYNIITTLKKSPPPLLEWARGRVHCNYIVHTQTVLLPMILLYVYVIYSVADSVGASDASYTGMRQFANRLIFATAQTYNGTPSLY